MALEHDAWLVDLDGTLYAGRPVKLALAAELALQGLSAVGTLRRFRSEHEHLRRTQAEPTASPYRLQLERTAEALGLEAVVVEAHVREWMIERPGKWLRRFRRRALLAELEAFRSRGGRLALVSDYPARRKLEALGCSGLFELVVASGEDGGPRWLKPHPDGLLRACEQLRVSPERCLVLGDRHDADGEAARRAGMAFRRVG
ncbi:MAG TPA: HAD family hydrolase [Polyangiaceae bacterium]|jgi:HAD superfamily hydrolase (TIGR01549 family)|nr:HAD family hydrolase [Polyangiaceae bacterium]